MSFPNRANRNLQIPRDIVVVVAVYAELPVHFDKTVFFAAASFSFVVRVADVLAVVVVAVGCTILIGGFLLLW